jgi:hypothetical protein
LKNKSLAILSPLCLALAAANAEAAIEPFTLGASETVKHESNVNHASTGAISDWISATEFTAALDQAVGRDKLVANAGVNYTAYRRHEDHDLNNWGYHAGAEFDFNTIGDISGAIGADTSRKRYVYGTTDTSLLDNPLTSTNELNMQKDSHVFGRLQLGGPSRWQIFTGADASRRTYSSSNFSGDDEHQWSANLGTRYETSPDLHVGLVANYTRGEYPHAIVASFGGVPITAVSRFRTRSISATTDLKATGNSTFDASLGYTTESADALTKDAKFVNGSLNWTWTPPSHFTVNLGLKRSMDVDTTSTGMNTGLLNVNNLNGVSINNTALLDVAYALTAKISLDANTAYTQRKYSDVRQLDGTVVGGTLNTSSFWLSVHWLPTRTTDLNCAAGRERRHSDTALSPFLPSYTDNTVQCAASIKFD